MAACSKSAQFLFSGWLITAMEGPTSVSALMHSATLVTVGAVLLLKCFNLLLYFLDFIFLIGLVAALFCAVMACLETDLKSIIAYSTCSQIGFIFIGISTFSSDLATLHLMNHAVFKSLFFFLAGLVIHEFKSQKVFGFKSSTINGLLRCMAVICCLSIIGVPLFGSSLTKEAILEKTTFNINNTFLFYCVVLASFFSILYSIRLYASLIYCYPGIATNKRTQQSGASVLVFLALCVIILVVCSSFITTVKSDDLLILNQLVFYKKRY